MKDLNFPYPDHKIMILAPPSKTEAVEKVLAKNKGLSNRMEMAGVGKKETS